MRRKVIIGKHNNTYFHCISTIKNKEGYIIESSYKSTEEQIRELLNIKIDKFKFINNLLIVKTNDDLVVIENYLQINHDKVFKSFNKAMSKMTINKRLNSMKLTLQHKSPYKLITVGCVTLSIALIASIAMTTPYTYTKPDYSSGLIGGPAITVVDNSPKMVELKLEDIQNTIFNKNKEVINKIDFTIDIDLILLIMKYSNMYFIDYHDAYKVVDDNEDIIKNTYANREIGVINTLRNYFDNDATISKEPIISDISSLEREKLLLEFAKIYGLNDADTVATLLAVYRNETGYGTSDACIKKNNFGGLKAADENTGKYHVISYKTPQIGAEAMVRTFIKIKTKSERMGSFNPSRSLAHNMNSIYCGESTWPYRVDIIKDEVKNDYNIESYLKEEKSQTLTKK